MPIHKWKIDNSHSGIYFVARHMIFAKVRGAFTKWSGQLSFDEHDLTTASLEIVIDASSLETNEPDRDKHLRSADFFDVERHPTATFRSRRVEPASGDAHAVYGDLTKLTGTRYRVHGGLTIRGVTRDVVLDAQHFRTVVDPWKADRAAFTATASIDRTEFGLKWNRPLQAGGFLVGERVELELELQAVKER